MRRRANVSPPDQRRSLAVIDFDEVGIEGKELSEAPHVVAGFSKRSVRDVEDAVLEDSDRHLEPVRLAALFGHREGGDYRLRTRVTSSDRTISASGAEVKPSRSSSPIVSPSEDPTGLTLLQTGG